MGFNLIVIAFLDAESFKISIYANERTCDVTWWTQNVVEVSSSSVKM